MLPLLLLLGALPPLHILLATSTLISLIFLLLSGHSAAVGEGLSNQTTGYLQHWVCSKS